MKTTMILMVCAAAAATAVQYVAPVASGYIYRSDNNGPASLIQLGAVPYPQQQIFAPPLPIAQPLQLQSTEALDLGPVPLPYIAAKPIVVQDAEEEEEDDDDDDDNDESDESSDEYLDGGNLVGLDHAHAYEKGAGSDYGEERHSAHGEKESKGYLSKGHHANGAAGNYGKEHNEGYYSENKGEKEAHHDEADAHGKQYESGENYKGGDHGHKKHFSKGEDVTGYHKVFHKDEFKKDHDFYDVADNSGHFNKHGYEKKHHGSEAGAHKKGGHQDAGYDKGDFGKAGFHSKGHVDVKDDSHSAEEGRESHYEREEDHAGAAGSSQQKQYGFSDEDDEY